MKKYLNTIFVVVILVFNNYTYAKVQDLDCDGSEANLPQCKLKIWEDGRCEKTMTVTTFCKSSSNACKVYAGGACWGETSDAKWFVLPDNNTNEMKRCACGCFGEETIFSSMNGNVTGAQLLEKKEGNILETLDYLDGSSWGFNRIKQIIGGKEEDLSYRLVTESGRLIELTNKHPVLIADEDGTTKKMITADQVKTGDLLLSDIDETDPVIRVEQIQYNKRMMNFVVESDNPINHIVIANGLRMGDNAWQNRLAATEARILDRADIVADIVAERKKQEKDE